MELYDEHFLSTRAIQEFNEFLLITNKRQKYQSKIIKKILSNFWAFLLLNPFPHQEQILCLNAMREERLYMYARLLWS